MTNRVMLASVKFLTSHNVPFRIIELPRAPKTAQEVVELYGCKLEQVCKTILLVGDLPVLVCLPGNRNIDFTKMAQVFGRTNFRLATAKEIKSITGFEIGGVSPFLENHSEIKVVLDLACLDMTQINIGSGIKTAGIEVYSANLKDVWPGIIADVSETTSLQR